jgi:predicted ATPase with chaperone activity
MNEKETEESSERGMWAAPEAPPARGWRDHVLLIGPVGAGKTLWARLQVPKIPLAEWWQRSMDTERLYRLARMEERFDSRDESFRPLRAPHHTVSERGLCGTVAKGWQIRPGELSLAHGGIFFLDVANEFSARCIAHVTQATERGYVEPAFGAFQLPSEFRLIASSPPCPCGMRGSTRVECRCTAEQVERYARRLDPLRKLCRVLEPREWQPEVTALAREQGAAALRPTSFAHMNGRQR